MLLVLHNVDLAVSLGPQQITITVEHDKIFDSFTCSFECTFVAGMPASIEGVSDTSLEQNHKALASHDVRFHFQDAQGSQVRFFANSG